VQGDWIQLHQAAQPVQPSDSGWGAYGLVTLGTTFPHLGRQKVEQNTIFEDRPVTGKAHRQITIFVLVFAEYLYIFAKSVAKAN
jgi:hypothetical protein